MEAPRKAYDAPGRRRQAEETRQRIIRAAHGLFLDHGYAATTLKEVAARAGVSLPTVYAVFGNKRALLLDVFEAARHMAGDHEADLEALIEEGKPLTPELIARRIRLTREGGAPVARIIGRSTAADRELAQLWVRIQAERHARMAHLAQTLAARQGLVPGLDADAAADALWAVTSNELYGLLVLDRRWSPDQYEQWLVSVLSATILPHGPGGSG